MSQATFNTLLRVGKVGSQQVCAAQGAASKIRQWSGAVFYAFRCADYQVSYSTAAPKVTNSLCKQAILYGRKERSQTRPNVFNQKTRTQLDNKTRYLVFFMFLCALGIGVQNPMFMPNVIQFVQRGEDCLSHRTHMPVTSQISLYLA